MWQNERKLSILVVSTNPQLAEITRKAVGLDIEVNQALNQAEGLSKIRGNHPDVVILGELGSFEAALSFFRQIRDGWISRHASVIIVKPDLLDNTYQILSDEDLSKDTGECRVISGKIPASLSTELFLPALKEAISRKLKQRVNKFRESILDPDHFCLVWEQIPGLGAFEMRQETVLENARKAARSGRVCALSITDNPGGNPAIATDILCAEVRKLGVEPVVHIAFRDRSRNQGESLLYQLAALEISNVLVLTGDYPSNEGFSGISKPVFDLDSVNALQLISEMNRGMNHEIMRKMTRLSPTHFFAGVAFTPFKQTEAEVMGQYLKLEKKIQAGAGFLIVQVGYDVRKLHELQNWLKIHKYSIPVLANIYVLSYPVARAMQENRIPGCVVTDKLLEQIDLEQKSPDQGRQARLERAAKMYALAKGMGFAGAYISGQGLAYESLEYVVNEGDKLSGNWEQFLPDFDYPQEKGFYLFEKDTGNGLNTEKYSSRLQRPARPLIYRLSLVIHNAVFESGQPLFIIMQRLANFVDARRTWKKVFGSLEYWIKTVLYGCKDCGDCALFDVAYLCPISQCPKNQRNGPCGGSFHGWCEVYPNEKQCIWVRAYLRLKSKDQEAFRNKHIIPPCNWGLWQTSSWLNYFLGRDHLSNKIGIKPPDSR